MCTVSNGINILTPNQRLTSVNQEINPTEFEGLTISSETMHYIPRGLEKFFPKLKQLTVYNSGLKIAAAEDLEHFTGLVYLNFNQNALEVLQSNLFKFSPKLKYINFNYNKLKFIGADILESLEILEAGYFQQNQCVSDYESGKSYIYRLKDTLRRQCHMPEAMQRQYAEIDRLKEALKTLEETNYGNCNGNLNTATTILHGIQQKCGQLPTDEGRSDFSAPTIVEFSSAEDIWSNFKIVSKNTRISIPTLNTLNDADESIRQISINHQQTFYLPTNFGELFPRLEELSVTFSGLYEVDDTVFENMENLKLLNLTGNMLQEILVPTFDGLKDLEKLDLSLNNIGSLETAIFKGLKNLETINLNGNGLLALDGNYFESSTDLKAVHLSNNNLKFISANLLSALTNLKVVDLKNNVCIDLQHPDANLADIEAKIIENCIAPVRFHCEEALSEQNVSGQCTAKLTINFPKAKILNFLNTSVFDVEVFLVKDQVMKYLPLELHKVFSKLNEVAVVNSSLTALQQSDFKGLDHVKIIKIIFNNISSIEEGTFTNVPLLEYLNLSENNIFSLPSRVFSKLKKMKFLILAGNKLKKLAADFLPKRNQIQELMVQGNQLQLIETKMLRLVRNAQVINFTGNGCIDLKYQKTDNSSRSMVEISGEIDLNCSADSSYEDESE